ncbi:MAG: zf-HC2 domain-containing protein [Aggregatilineales bacterium]
MDCETLIRYLSDYIDQNLEEALAEAAREHLATCPNCRVVLNSTERMIILYREQQVARVIPATRSRILYASISAIFAERRSG